MSNGLGTDDEERGMRAVHRVRSAREADSRLGLQQAVAEHRAAGVRVTEIRRRIAETHQFDAGSTGSFLALRGSLDALGDSLRQAQTDWETSRTITDVARVRWQDDRTRLAAIELLLERRAEQRRAAARRREANDLDELAAQRWQRDRATRTPSGGDAA